MWIVVYLLTIPIANWMIGNVGACADYGPCLIPVGFGLVAPSGVLMIGAALVCRDMVQRRFGWRVALGCIAVGCLFSFAVAPHALVVASVAAFALSEVLDQAVYTPLAKRNLVGAVMASGLVGSIADSAVFLWLAFGSFDFIVGQVVGKIMMVAAASAVLWAVTKYFSHRPTSPQAPSGNADMTARDCRERNDA